MVRKTPLHVACHRGNLSMVLMLLRNKADFMAVTDGGFTPLHVAAQNNFSNVIDVLVTAGASVNVQTKVGCTPLHESAGNNCKEATLRLLKLNADPTIRDFRYKLTPAELARLKGYGEIENIISLYMKEHNEDKNIASKTVAPVSKPLQPDKVAVEMEKMRKIEPILNSYHLSIKDALTNPVNLIFEYCGLLKNSSA